MKRKVCSESTFFIFITLVLINFFFAVSGLSACQNGHITLREDAAVNDSLPPVFAKCHGDLVEYRLRMEAARLSSLHQLPGSVEEWVKIREQLRNQIIKKTGVVFNHQLPLNMTETGTVRMEGYSIRKITFQTRPGVYATANLYIPDGPGPFPAVINMHGHWMPGKVEETSVQAVGHALGAKGYVCLSIDAWGAGERSTIHGKFEDHGDNNNLGSALLNIGETLMGMELSDNIRGVDLLASLPFVDKNNIGATGASGGGNQTMWLSAMDERIKAAVPVVSVGTFESYIMGTPCICEVMIDGLTFAEESDIIDMIAPRAVKMINHLKDSNPAFYPSAMMRSYYRAKPLFEMMGKENNIAFQVFDLTHGYWPEDRQAMLGWFDLHLKGIGNGEPVREIPFKTLPQDQLMVFAPGTRDENLVTTEKYCREKGRELRNEYLSKTSFDTELKRKELKEILRVSEYPAITDVKELSVINNWKRFALQTSDNKLIPLLLCPPATRSGHYVIITNPDGKDKIPLPGITDILRSGWGIAIADLSGTGEAVSTSSQANDRRAKLRTIARSELWTGKTVPGEWVMELYEVSEFLLKNQGAQKIRLEGTKESGLASLFLYAMDNMDKIESVTLRDCPISYLFDNRESVDFYNLGINLPGILVWGDVSLAVALSGKNVTFINPLTMSGQKITDDQLKEYQAEYDKIRKACHTHGKATFQRL